MKVMAYQITPMFLQPFFQAYIKENIKAHRHWPFVRGIRRWPVEYPHKRSITREMFPCHFVTWCRRLCLVPFHYPSRIITSLTVPLYHDDVIKWKKNPRYWPFVRGIHRWPVNSPAHRPVTQSFDVFFDLRLEKQSWCWWFETPSFSSWRHSNVYAQTYNINIQ